MTLMLNLCVCLLFGLEATGTRQNDQRTAVMGGRVLASKHGADQRHLPMGKQSSAGDLPYRKVLRHSREQRLLAQASVPDMPRRQDFVVAGHQAFVVEPPPESRREGRMPWVWYAPTFIGRYPNEQEQWMFDRFHAAGIGVAGVDVGESHGSPQGRAIYQSLYEELTQKRGYAKKPILLGRSRGGLMLYSWAAEHPACVGGIAGIYPVCNIRTYPGLETAAAEYGITADQLEARIVDYNPIDRLSRLAKSEVPIMHLHGDQDEVVPLEMNSAIVEKRYRALGGTITVEVMKGQGHNLWKGWFQSPRLTEFIISQAWKSNGSASKLESAKGARD